MEKVDEELKDIWRRLDEGLLRSEVQSKAYWAEMKELNRKIITKFESASRVLERVGRRQLALADRLETLDRRIANLELRRRMPSPG